MKNNKKKKKGKGKDDAQREKIDNVVIEKGKAFF